MDTYTPKARASAGLQLQFFDHATKQYQPSAHQGVLDTESVQIAACGRAWRIAKPDRSLKPSYHAPRTNRQTRDQQRIRAEYMDWAYAKGLKTITDWKHKGPARRFAFTRLVDKELYFAATVEEVQS